MLGWKEMDRWLTEVGQDDDEGVAMRGLRLRHWIMERKEGNKT